MQPFDVVVIGGGFGGVHALHRLRGDHARVCLLEAGTGVGGTWFWNRYPGARCDLESLTYSYTFSPELYEEWHWSERYATQPELERYANWVVDRLNLRTDIRLNARVVSANFDSDAQVWTLVTDAGEEYVTRFVVAAVGALSIPTLPEVDGIDEFQGELIHTARWPDGGVDLDRRRVGVIGTGSSGVQVIPSLAARASELVVFQRTPNFCVPAGQMSADVVRASERKRGLQKWREDAYRAVRGIPLDTPPFSGLAVSAQSARARLEERWAEGGSFAIPGAFTDVVTSPEVNAMVVDFIRDKIRATVKDPATAALLSSMDYPYGARRVCVEDGYYETYNRDNVSLVDVRSNPISRFTRQGLELQDGTHVDLDVIVLATGFDALTGSLTHMDVYGRHGRTIRNLWAAEGPKALLGLMTAGFPNLFMINGPMSPSVLSNMLLGIEVQVDWISDCLTYMNDHGLGTVEASSSAEEEWAVEVADAASQSLYAQARSWYSGDNIPGKPKVFAVYIGGFNRYADRCSETARNGFEGFAFEAAVVPAARA